MAPRGSNSLQLLKAMLRFQRKNGYIFSAWGILRLIEHQIIIELDRSSLMRPVDLCIRLSQPPANVSHVMKSLGKRRLVREINGDSKREKFILLTKKGKALSSELDDLSNSLMDGLAASLNDDEQRQVYDLWESINNALDAPPTSVKPGDHPLRLQTRRFTRVFGFLAKKPGQSALTYPEIHVLDVLALTEYGVPLANLSETLRASLSTLKKIVTKLHGQGLCSSPTTKQGSVVRISNVGRELLDRTVGEFAQALDNSFSPPVVEKLDQGLSLFQRMVDDWNPVYARPDKGLRVKTGRDFFTRLRIQHLRSHARNWWGLDPNLEVIHEPTSRTLLLSRGATPCLYVMYRGAGAELTLDDFGCAPTVDWDEVTSRFVQVVEELHPQNSIVILHTNHLTAPLQALLQFSAVARKKLRFAHIPTSN